MRKMLRHAVPSMFHRRLLLVLTGIVCVTLILGVQVARLTLGASAAQSRQEAEDALKMHDVIETVRGRILDRKGRVLAMDQPGWDVAVDYRVISGQWADRQALSAAKKTAGQSWYELSADERDALIREHRDPYDQQVELLWQTLGGIAGTDQETIERRLNDVRKEVSTLSSHLYELWRLRRMQELRENVTIDEVVRPIAEQQSYHTVLRDVPESTRKVVDSFIRNGQVDPALEVWQQVELRQPRQRRYPLETLTIQLDRSALPTPLRHDDPVEVTVQGVGLHILGQMRDVWQQDFEGPDSMPRFDVRHDLKGYRAGDRMGGWGIESSMEHRLRGTRGTLVEHLDTQVQDRVEPTPGRDVRLTIDIQLQAHIAAMMDPSIGLMVSQPWHGPYGKSVQGQELTGAAVVIEVESGHVLAAVSHPGFGLEQMRDDPDSVFRDAERLPFTNRAVARPYNPGSTIKPVLLAAAISAGVHGVDDVIVCDGHLEPGHPDRYRCWIFKKYLDRHGPLQGPEAIARSCNIFFYTLGREMGIKRLADWYGRFGLGRKPDCALQEALPGTLPDPAKVSRANAVADATFLGIGQGPINWTALQAANSYATLARGGIYMDPTFVVDEHRSLPRQQKDIQLHPAGMVSAIKGLDWASNDGSMGTTHHLPITGREKIFNVDGVRIMAKSGTADPGNFRWIDLDFDNSVDEGEIVKNPDYADHAWCVAMIQPEGATKPTHVVAVIVEYAGSGGATSGPIVNQIVHAMVEEGYLATAW